MAGRFPCRAKYGRMDWPQRCLARLPQPQMGHRRGRLCSIGIRLEPPACLWHVEPVRLKLLFPSVFFALGQAWAGPAESENQINNPGFEEGQAAWTISTSREEGSGNPVEVVVGTAGKEVVRGTQALRIRSPKGNRSIYQARRAGDADQGYKLSIWARKGDPSVPSTISAHLTLIAKDGNHVGSQTVTLYAKDGSAVSPESLKAEWQEFRAPVKVDEEKNPKAARFWLSIDISGDVVIDEIVLIPGE